MSISHHIKEIGRGKDGARDMSEQEAYELFGAIRDASESTHASFSAAAFVAQVAAMAATPRRDSKL